MTKSWLGGWGRRCILPLKALPELQSPVECKRKGVYCSLALLQEAWVFHPTYLLLTPRSGNIICLRKQYHSSFPLLEIIPCWEPQESHLVPEAWQ